MDILLAYYILTLYPHSLYFFFFFVIALKNQCLLMKVICRYVFIFCINTRVVRKKAEAFAIISIHVIKLHQL